MNRSFVNNFVLFYIFISIGLGKIDIESASNYNLKLNRELLRAGEIVSLIINVDVAEGYYIYSSDPSQSLSPTTIDWNDSLYFSKISIIHEPIPKIKYDPNFKMDIGYHSGTVQFKQDLQILKSLDPGSYSKSGTFQYQVCDPKICIPHWEDYSVNLIISPGEPREEFIFPLISDYESKKHINNSSNVNELNDVIEKGLTSFILFAIGMGFLALLTPCVFPMIPITVSFFTKMGEDKNSSPLYSSSIYTIGIITIFTSLGLILALSLGATGANQLASNPWVNLFIAALFVYFAFSLFGHYEIQIPSVIRQFSTQQEQKGGVVGILFMALTFTLTSFTCTVQFVGLLLVAASQGEFFWPVIGMIAFSSAFASPFFFLALFPQYLAKLPQSGGWLNSVKVIMGFLELGAAMKFLSNSDLVWQWGIFTYQSVLSVWAIISFMMGIYLLGKIKLPHDSEIKVVGVPRLILSTIFLSFSIYLTSGLFGQPLHGLIDSYLPPKMDISTINKNEKSIENELIWYDNFSEGLNIGIEKNKPIFIDFTGYTCTNCRWMETNIFVDREVEKLFKEFILVKLYTDGGKYYRENQKIEVERFGTAALPFYVILSPDNQEVSRFHGMDPDVNKFVAFLANALEIMKGYNI